jgi:hypothetical protein
MKGVLMNTAHWQTVYEWASAEHRHLRLLLVEIQNVIAEFSQAKSKQGGDASDTGCVPLRHKLSTLLEQFRRGFEQEGASGEVAITLACDRRLDAEVSALSDRQHRLERTLGVLLDALERTEDLRGQLGMLENALAEFSADLVAYSSMKMDALRRSLSEAREGSGHGRAKRCP